MSTKKTTARAKAKPRAQAKKPARATTNAKPQTGIGGIKMLSAKPSTKIPPNNPDVPQATIDHLNAMLNDLKIILDNYAQHCQKAKGFLARSLRIAQTPYINSWSFVRPLAKWSYKTPKLSGYAG